jgi:hypothetical protein
MFTECMMRRHQSFVLIAAACPGKVEIVEGSA